MDPINTNIENDLRALRDDELDTITGGSDGRIGRLLSVR